MEYSAFDTEYDRTNMGNDVSRLPSLTPSEADLLNTKAAKILCGFHRPGKRHPWLLYSIIISILAIVVLSAVFEDNISTWLKPGVRRVQNVPAGFVVPVVMFIIISFPPLFGQEILALLVGLVWGLWPGFAIVCVGLTVGEALSFYASRYWIRKFGEALERQAVQYAALAKIIREGGIVVAIVARYSIIPNHYLKALFSICDASHWVFFTSFILSLPLYLVAVFYGKIFVDEAGGKTQALDNAVGYFALATTSLVTCAATLYLGNRIDKIKGDLVMGRRKDRQVNISPRDFLCDDKPRMRIDLPTGTRTEFERLECAVRQTPMGNGYPVLPNIRPPAYPPTAYAPENIIDYSFGGESEGISRGI